MSELIKIHPTSLESKREMISNQRSHLQLEISPPIRGPTSNWRSHLHLEVSPPIGDLTSNWRSHLQIRGPMSNWRSHLQLEVPPPGGIFVPSGVITMLDHIKNNDPFLPDVPLHQDPLLKPSTLQSTNKTKVNT